MRRLDLVSLEGYISYRNASATRRTVTVLFLGVVTSISILEIELNIQKRWENG